MKTLLLTLFTVVLLPTAAFASRRSVYGQWKTIDDQTGKPKSIIEISEAGDGLSGKIVELIEPREPNPKCSKCSDKNKDKPILGMEIMSGFRPDEDRTVWTDGRILDPKNGKTYKCKIKLHENGEKLDVRGYVGMSLIGRTQTWVRHTPPQ